MTSRERVRATLRHQQPDKTVVDFNAHHSSGIMIQAYRKLREYLGLPKSKIYVYDMVQQLALVEDDVLDIVGGDIVEIGHDYWKKEDYWKDWQMHDGSIVKIPSFVNVKKDANGDYVLYSDSGVAMGIQKKSALYFDQTHYPLSGCEDPGAFSKLESYMQDAMWFKVGIPPCPAGFDKAGLEERRASAKALRESTDRAIYATFGGNILEGGEFLFGIEEFFLMMAGEPELTHKFFGALLEKNLRELELYLGAVGEYIDIIHFSDDMGTQNGPLISPKMYREFIKPAHKQMWALVKKLVPEVKISLHCCGGVEPLIPDLIDAGLDAINPVQTTCKDMELESLKKKFGKDLVFWGGGCDTRDILPNGTVEEIREHVRNNVKIMSPGGGYVFQQVHNIMADVKPENVMAMFNAVNG